MIRTQTLVLSGISAFALGWGVILLYDNALKENTTVIESTRAPLPRLGSSAHQRTSSRAKLLGEMDFADYYLHIQNLRSSEECEACFESMIKDSFLSQRDRAIRLSMILNKWGEISPRYAIQKVSVKNFANFEPPYARPALWVSCVFSGWTSQSPEDAASFFKEHKATLSKNNIFIAFAITEKWSDDSPLKAWNWLTTFEKNPPTYINYCKTIIINKIHQHDVDGIPDFIAKLDERDSKRYSPTLWEKWFSKYPDSPEIMASLSGENKTAALLGSISSKTKGDLDAVMSELSIYNREEQQKLLFALAPHLISGDKTERDRRLRWLMKNAPGALLENSVQSSLRDWFVEKRIEAKEVLDNLPRGKEKEELQNSFENAPVMPYIF